MYIINETYFTRKLNVPSIKGQSQTREGAKDEFESYIDSVSRLLLKLSLGNVNFKDFDSYVDTDGNLLNTAPQKWIDLVNGKDYIKGDKTYTWQGLKQEEGVFKESVLAYFTWLVWFSETRTQVADIGEVVLEGKNSFTVNGTERYVKTWNEFVLKYQGKYHNYNKPYIYYHNNVIVRDYFCDNEDGYVSLLEFLKDNKTDYPNSALKTFNFKNQLGL